MNKKRRLLFVLLLTVCGIPIFAQDHQALSVSLNDLFVIADSGNRQLHILENYQRIAQEAVKEEKQKLLPTLSTSLNLSYNGNGWVSDRNFSKGQTTPIPHFGNNFALEAQQIIYAGGALKTALQMAKQNVEITKQENEAARQDIRFAIAGHYLQILKLENQQTILKKNILQTQKMIEQINAKKQQGVALKNTITRYELQLQSLELALLQSKNTTLILNNELVRLLLLPQGTQLQLNKDIAAISLYDQTTDQQSSAASTSPLLKKAALQTKQAKSHEKFVASEKLPQVYAFAADYLNGPVMIEVPVLNKNFNYWYAGVGIKYNISPLFQTDTKLKQAKLATQNAIENEHNTKEQLAKDIESARIRYIETRMIYQTQLKAIELATQNYTVLKNRYLNDLALITEMLDAENAKLDAEMQAANAQITILFHWYQLKKLNGTL